MLLFLKMCIFKNTWKYSIYLGSNGIAHINRSRMMLFLSLAKVVLINYSDYTYIVYEWQYGMQSSLLFYFFIFILFYFLLCSVVGIIEIAIENMFFAGACCLNSCFWKLWREVYFLKTKKQSLQAFKWLWSLGVFKIQEEKKKKQFALQIKQGMC